MNESCNSGGPIGKKPDSTEGPGSIPNRSMRYFLPP